MTNRPEGAEGTDWIDGNHEECSRGGVCGFAESGELSVC